MIDREVALFVVEGMTKDLLTLWGRKYLLNERFDWVAVVVIGSSLPPVT